MTKQRDLIIKTLFRGHEPFEVDYSEWPVDRQGWRSNHEFLITEVQRLKPKTILEVGVWKGGSVITMAAAARDVDLDSVVVAVDTFAGSQEHWIRDKNGFNEILKVRGGRPIIYETFMSNIIDAGLTDYVLPFPVDSFTAYKVLDNKKITFDLIHIDADHEYQSAMKDLTMWTSLLNPGGSIICDDYHKSWPGVVRAVNEFKTKTNMKFSHKDGKALLQS